MRRDIDPPELRAAIAGAFTDLAAAGEEGYDLTALRNLGLRFLDYDWESRYQSINQVGAERFYRELTAAEAFLTAAVDEASDEDRLHWLALRGRMRFWLSTLDGEGLDHDSTLFRDWLEGAIADYAAAGGPEKVGLWDATIIGGAYSRMIELAEYRSRGDRLSRQGLRRLPQRHRPERRRGRGPRRERQAGGFPRLRPVPAAARL